MLGHHCSLKSGVVTVARVSPLNDTWSVYWWTTSMSLSLGSQSIHHCIASPCLGPTNLPIARSIAWPAHYRTPPPVTRYHSNCDNALATSRGPCLLYRAANPSEVDSVLITTAHIFIRQFMFAQCCFAYEIFTSVLNGSNYLFCLSDGTVDWDPSPMHITGAAGLTVADVTDPHWNTC